jgi:hypothetical protein
MTTPYPLGRVVEHDERSRAYGVTMPKRVALTSKNWYHYGPVLNQGSTSSCTGHALAQCLNTRPLRRKGEAFPLLRSTDAITLYSMATTLDEFPGEYPPDDKGSSGLAVCKAAVAKGMISRYEHCFGLEQTLATLMRQPVIIGTVWFSRMFYPNASGFVSPTGTAEGGHEYMLIGLNAKARYVTGLNSWGKEWGINGRFKITFDNLDALLHANGDVTVPVK